MWTVPIRSRSRHPYGGGAGRTPTGQEARSSRGRAARGLRRHLRSSTHGDGHEPAPHLPRPARTGPAARRSSAGKIIAIVVAAVVVLGGLAAAALFLLAKPVIDETKVQAEIVRITRDASGLAPTDVRCPTDVPLKAGNVFTCTAQLDGQQVTYTVKQNDDQGNVHIQSSGLVVVDKIEKTLAERVTQNTGVTTLGVDCANGKQVVVGGKGTTFPCLVTNTDDPSDTLTVTATVTERRRHGRLQLTDHPPEARLTPAGPRPVSAGRARRGCRTGRRSAPGGRRPR